MEETNTWRGCTHRKNLHTVEIYARERYKHHTEEIYIQRVHTHYTDEHTEGTYK